MSPVTVSANALYTDLSAYYDLMCADIDYHSQSHGVRRLHQLFGNKGQRHLDLACGTGPYLRHFIDFGYQCSGLDIHQPMLDRAKLRCPEAQLSLQNMAEFTVNEPVDLITCFLYSIHYSASIKMLTACINRAYHALAPSGMLCFNGVDKQKINNHSFTQHSTHNDGSLFIFRSGWNYEGTGEQQWLKLRIEKQDQGHTQVWDDQHPMVAVSFNELVTVLQPYFDVHIFEHDYHTITPWDKKSGNAIFVCIKK